MTHLRKGPPQTGFIDSHLLLSAQPKAIHKSAWSATRRIANSISPSESWRQFPQRGFRNQVIAITCEQPHPVAVALDDQAVVVVLDLVPSLRPFGNLGPSGGNTGLNILLSMTTR